MLERAHCRGCGDVFLREAAEGWKLLCLPCWRRRKAAAPTAATAPRPAPLIEEAMLKRLLFLAHPDKHNQSEASLIATRWLLEQRRKLEVQHHA